MRFDYSTSVFAAGDNGIRSSGSLDRKTSVFTLGNVSRRLNAADAKLFSLLPNAQVEEIYGTDADVPVALSAARLSLAWQVLVSGKSAVVTSQIGSLLASPLSEPILPGYPGALVFYREPQAAPFTAKDFSAATQQAESLERQIASGKPSAGPCGLMVIDSKLKSLIAACGPESLDSQLKADLLDDAKSRFTKRPRKLASRVRLYDARGIARNFRVELRRKVAFTDGPVLTYTLSPSIAAWSHLDESMFASNPDISRLIPALQFMIARFASLPALPQVAAKAKLSPFHFHREFTALLGISPKHLMLDCQVESAGRQLQTGGVDLIDVAHSCGFAHQSHFTSRFKQATGLTPTGWRKAMRQA